MNETICQSCAMPLKKDSDKGTNSDGSISNDYCRHCYESGSFIGYATLEEAIADSANFAKEAGMTKEEILEYSAKVLPTLKRWRSD